MIAETADEIAPWTEVPDAVWRALRGILAPYVSASFTIDGDPKSKERPRFSKGGHVITPKKTMAAEAIVRAAFREALPDWEPEPDWTFGVLVEFRTSSGSAVDIDNTQKLVMDSLNTTKEHRGFWLDDIQVGTVFMHLTRGQGTPSTEIQLFRVADNGTPPTRLCELCGDRFRNVRDALCYSCRKERAQVKQQRALGAAERADEDLHDQKRRAYRFVVATLVGYGTSPATKDIAERLGVTERRARIVVNALIADGILARDGRTKLKVVKQMGAAA